ncbi:MAG: porin [Verrucomicrobiales bacterium]
MTTKLIRTIGVGIAATAAAHAGEMVMPKNPVAPAPAPAGDWCDTLQTFGTLYKDKSNPFIQEFKVFGRFQYQWGYTDGETNGNDFDGNGDEIRRFRLGTQIKFLNGFKLKANANLEEGGFRNHEIGYHSLDEAYLAYSFGEVGSFDDLSLSVGRHKYNFTGEAHTSSKSIKTVERSNVANAFYNSARPTSVMLTVEREGMSLTGGVLSTDEDPEFGGWDEGIAYYLTGDFAVGNGNVIVDFTYNDADPATEVDGIGYEWGLSAAYFTEIANWELMVNGVYGENHGGDALYGLVIMPSTFLIEDRLELVGRYQFFGSDGDNVKINSRNVRNVASHDGASISTGDSNHTFYAGLNYYLCDHNAKIMTGVEYETLEGSNEDLDATTVWAAFRMFF